MGFWSEFVETPWNKEIRLLTAKVQQLDDRCQAHADLNKKLTGELDKAKNDVRRSEQSEATLRSLKNLIEAELDEKNRLLALVEKRAGTDAQEGQAEIDELLERRAQAQHLRKKHPLLQTEEAPPSSKRRRGASRAHGS